MRHKTEHGRTGLPVIDEATLDHITLAVFRARLDTATPGEADRQLARDGDGGARQLARARAYRPLVAETLIQASRILALAQELAQELDRDQRPSGRPH